MHFFWTPCLVAKVNILTAMIDVQRESTNSLIHRLYHFGPLKVSDFVVVLSFSRYIHSLLFLHGPLVNEIRRVQNISTWISCY